jgi:hypothetical protein
MAELGEPNRRKGKHTPREQSRPKVLCPVIHQEEHAEAGKDECQEKHHVIGYDGIACQEIGRGEDRDDGDHVLRQRQHIVQRVEDVGVEQVPRISREGMDAPGKDPGD